MRLDRWFARAALLAVSCSGCNALLGVEDLKVSPDAGANSNDHPDAGHAAGAGTGAGTAGVSAAGAGAAGHAGAGASAAGSGGKFSAGAPAAGAGAGGAGGSAGSAGSVAGAGGTAGAGVAGSNAGAGGSAAGSGGSGGAGGGVQGKVIDYYRHPLAGVAVRIGDKQTTTDGLGQFSVSDVAASYDVGLTINTSVRNIATTIAWQVQGLTRRDPTLQVYRGLPDRDGELLMHIQHVTFPLASNQKLLMTWTGVDGSFSLDVDSMDTDFISAAWIGATMAQGSAHALLFDYASPGDTPTMYRAHDVHPVAMVDGMQSEVTFDLTSSSNLAAGAVTGSVTGPTANERSTLVYLRFADNTAIELVYDSQATGSFSYLVPNIAGSAITIVAQDQIPSGGLGAAYADNLAAPQAGVALTIPSVPSLSAPGANTSNVTGTNLFQWSSDAHVFLFCARSTVTYDQMCVVTSNKQTKLPIGASTGYEPAANEDFTWSIETHGSYADVDEASSDTGFLSPFAYGAIRGPRRGSGTYAESPQRVFTTAP